MNVETLSPKARAVYEAIAEISPAPTGEIAAVAIRTAVEKAFRMKNVFGTSRLESVFEPEVAYKMLLAIADELETL